MAKHIYDKHGREVSFPSGILGWAFVLWFVYLVYYWIMEPDLVQPQEPTPACKAMTIQAETIDELMKVFTARNELTIMKEGKLDL